MTAIVIHLPKLPPSANRLWRRSGTRIHKSDSYQSWLTAMGWEIKAQQPGKINGSYKLIMFMARPDQRRRDLDNGIKAVSDLLVSVGIVSDDSLCEMVSARWVTTGSGVTVRLEQAGVE